jgi:hypothetical protein
MMTPKAGLRELVHDLRATLDGLAAGLVDGEPDALLAAEPRLAALVAAFAGRLDSDQPPARADLLAARHALRRCEALGLTLTQLGQVYAAANGGYTRSGRFPAPDAPGVLQARG